MVKWLWSIDQGIDIHVENEEAFQLSCENGHLEVAKWLWSLDQGIDIHAGNEYAF